MQDLSFNQVKLKILDTFRKDEKITTNFEPTDDSDVINKAYRDKNLKKIVGHFSYIEHDYKQFILQYNKQTVEEVLVQGTVKTTIQKLFDKGLFDAFPKADKVLQDFFFTTSRKLDLGQVNYDIQ